MSCLVLSPFWDSFFGAGKEHLLTSLPFWHLSAGWALGKGGWGGKECKVPPCYALVLEPSLSLRRDYSVLESAIKYMLKINNGQMGAWEDEVLVF